PRERGESPRHDAETMLRQRLGPAWRRDCRATRRDLSSVAAPWAEPSMLARFSLVTRGIHGSQSLRPFGLEHRRDEWRIQHGSFQREDEVVVARRHLD